MSKEPELTWQLQTKICDYVQAGNYPRIAARLVGVSKGVWNRWIAAGQEGIEPFAGRLDAIEMAEAEFIHWATEEITAGGEKHKPWARLMTMLERRHPEMYGRRDRTPLDVIKEQAREEAKKQGLDPQDAVKEAERIYLERS